MCAVYRAAKTASACLTRCAIWSTSCRRVTTSERSAPRAQRGTIFRSFALAASKYNFNNCECNLFLLWKRVPRHKEQKIMKKTSSKWTWKHNEQRKADSRSSYVYNAWYNYIHICICCSNLCTRCSPTAALSSSVFPTLENIHYTAESPNRQP